MKKYLCFVCLIQLSCHSPELKRELIYSNGCGIDFYAECDTSFSFNQSGKCKWILKGVANYDSINEEINKFGYFDFLDSCLIFYTSRRIGIDFGWHRIENGKAIEFNEILQIYNDSFKLTHKYFYRNGQISDDDILTDIKVDYGEIHSIEKPLLNEGFGIYKLVGNKLILVSRSSNYDLLSNDGIYYITMPGLIDNCIINLKCDSY